MVPPVPPVGSARAGSRYRAGVHGPHPDAPGRLSVPAAAGTALGTGSPACTGPQRRATRRPARIRDWRTGYRTTDGRRAVVLGHRAFVSAKLQRCKEIPLVSHTTCGAVRDGWRRRVGSCTCSMLQIMQFHGKKVSSVSLKAGTGQEKRTLSVNQAA